MSPGTRVNVRAIHDCRSNRPDLPGCEPPVPQKMSRRLPSLQGSTP
jgi:hypothetical protein